MKYYCETCGKTFNSEDKCLECENNHRAEMAKQECLRKEQASRWEEVEDAYKKYQELYTQYNKDYNIQSLPKVYSTLLDDMFNTIFYKG